jgi:hypothetical protein
MNDHRGELADTMGQMSDEELLERWRSGNFTEVAVEVARSELSRRGIDAPEFVPMQLPDDDPAMQGEVSFVTIVSSLEPMQIEMLRARLQAEGIMVVAVDAGITQANALYAIAVGGVRLMVPKESADEARHIIGLIQSGCFALREDDEPLP